MYFLNKTIKIPLIQQSMIKYDRYNEYVFEGE